MTTVDAGTLPLDLADATAAEDALVVSAIQSAIASGITLTDEVLVALDRLARLRVREARSAGAQPRQTLERECSELGTENADAPPIDRGSSLPCKRTERRTPSAGLRRGRPTISAGVARWQPVPSARGRATGRGSDGRAVLARVAALAAGTASAGVLEPPASGPPEDPATAKGGRGEVGPYRPPAADGSPIDQGCGPAAIASADLDGPRRGEPEGDLPLGPPIGDAPPLELPDGTCVMAPRLDGGTRFWIDLNNDDIARFPQWFAGLVSDLRRRRTQEEKRQERKGGDPVVLVQRRQPSLLDGDHYAATWGASGEDWARKVWFYVEDMFHVTIEPISPRKGYAMRVVVEAKARLLHTRIDQREIAGSLLCEAHWWLTGEHVPPDQLRRLGWSTANIEECADFYRLPWQRDDAVHFVVPNKMMKTGDVSKVIGSDPFFAATVMVGTRASDFSFVLYNKSEQIDEVKGGDCSAYAPIWRAHGLADEHLGEISRVEFRMKGRALRWVDKETGELLDLRDPMVASDPAVLAQVWANVTGRRVRLFVPGATRRKRCKTDSRWEKVRSASSAEAHEMMQDREPQEDAHAAAVLRALRQHLMGAQRIAALHDARITSREGYAAITTLAVHRIEELEQHPVFGDGNEYTERGRKYRMLRLSFLGDEIRSARVAIERERELGNPMHGVELYRYEDTG